MKKNNKQTAFLVLVLYMIMSVQFLSAQISIGLRAGPSLSSYWSGIPGWVFIASSMMNLGLVSTQVLQQILL